VDDEDREDEMDLSLTEEQKALRDLAREFADKEIEPKVKHHDETGDFPDDIVKKAWELGITNVHVPEEYGGLGLGLFEGCLIVEELAYTCSGISTAMESNTLVVAPLMVAGNEEQKKEYLGRMIEGPVIAAYCVTEPGAGSDVSNIQLKAKKVGDEYVLNGSKMWITGAGPANFYFVLVRTGEPESKHRGLSAFIVDRDSEGIEVGKKEWNLGQHASDTRGITFTDVKVPAKNLLGREGQGFVIAMKAFDHTRPGISAGAVGVARRALDEAVRYAKERKTFGVPLWRHQGIQFMVADMARDIEAARLLVWQSAWKFDHGERNTYEAACAKCFGGDMAMRVAIDAVQILGGYGYSTEYPVEKLMRDAKIFQIYEGTSQIQRLIIAREVFGHSR